MKLKTYMIPLFGSMLAASSAVYGEWELVVDFEDYEITECEDCLIERGWVFQDYDFIGFPQCVNGTNDCTGMRTIDPAPFEGGRGKVMALRAGDPEESLVANSRAITAFDLPSEIPVGSVATFYMRVAFERQETSQHWGLTQYAEPTSDATGDNPTHDYPDLAVTSQLDLWQRNIFYAYNGWWEPAYEDTTKEMLPGDWFEIWYLIQNNELALGGGLFDIYIRGGPFEEITHLPNPHLSDEVKEMGITQWGFRNNTDEPIRRWLNIINGGNPNTNFRGTAAMYIDDFWLNVGEMTTEQPPLPPIEDTGCEYDWYPLAATVDGYMESDTLGWIYVYTEDWGYSGYLGNIYTGACSALYQTKVGWMVYVTGDQDGLWLYSMEQGWVYVSAANGGWYQYSIDGTSWEWGNFRD
jgi:hypothetical protein